VRSLIRNIVGATIANLGRQCRILSTRVSPAAIAGQRGIEIQRGTSIDSASSIGGYTYIGCYCYITASKIGRYCSIANNVSVGQGEHALDRPSTSSLFYPLASQTLTADECEIGSDVWIGVDAIILRGVKIGVGAVVAANAVVSKDVPPYAIVAGVPARLIRFRIPEERHQKMLACRWWELDRPAADAALADLDKLPRQHVVISAVEQVRSVDGPEGNLSDWPR
jgi:virginiamycin A acetyltransferase